MSGPQNGCLFEDFPSSAESEVMELDPSGAARLRGQLDEGATNNFHLLKNLLFALFKFFLFSGFKENYHCGHICPRRL